MLVNIMILAFGLMIPTALYEFGVLSNDIWEYILLINPVQAAAEVIGGGFQAYEITWIYYFSLGYMIIGAVVVYRFLVLPKFHDYAIKQSGV
jgi:fluoroquinolone transport system permease protein